jgi:hypothetical protein
VHFVRSVRNNDKKNERYNCGDVDLTASVRAKHFQRDPRQNEGTIARRNFVESSKVAGAFCELPEYKASRSISIFRHRQQGEIATGSIDTRRRESRKERLHTASGKNFEQADMEC